MDWEQRWVDGDIDWDHGRASPPLEEYLAGKTLAGRALVPGCGSGHDVRLLARHGLEVTGLDIAPSAIATARSYPGIQNEDYREGDWLNLPGALRGEFDWVIEHTCLCALPPVRRTEYAASVFAALRPGGHYLAVFYSRPAADEGPPFGITASELDDLFRPLELIERWQPTAAYTSRIGREEMRLYRKSD